MSAGAAQRGLVGVLSVMLLASASSSASAITVYVDDDADPNGDGLTWQTAYDDLQAALDDGADPNSDVSEIHVAGGTYKPSNRTDPNDPRTATFQLLNDVALMGAYAGLADPNNPDVRDIAGYRSVLTGDIGTSDDSTDNCYHVVTGSGTDETAVLDGVTITGGNANSSSPHNNGGGMLNSAGSPTVNHCTLVGNTAVNAGGGMQNYGSAPTVANCTFKGNTADYGGGVNNGIGSTSTLVNCTFSGNAVTLQGGGVRNWESASKLINCTVAGNSTADAGGGVYNYLHNPTLANCIVWGNTSATGEQIDNSDGASPSVTYSCIEGGWSGERNIDGNPMFVRDPSAGPDEEWGTADDDYGDLHLACGSPCLDAGTNTTDPALPDTDADGGPRIVNDMVDMGAYEGIGGNAFVVTPPSVVVPEGGSAEFTVALGCDPNGVVSVDVSFESGDSDIAVATAMPLVFDSSDYWIGQSVTLAAAEDPDQLAGTAIIAVTASGCRPAQVTPSELDNDVPAVLYVDASATGVGDGSSWVDAYPGLHEALIVAAGAPLTVDEIRVAGGTYAPDPSGLSDPRMATFQLISGVTLKGGYAGLADPNAPDTRDIATFESILTGDLAGNDGPDFANYGENVQRVVFSSGTDETAVLDGVTVTAGNAGYSGGGIRNVGGSPTLIDCTVSYNLAKYFGGGFENVEEGSPTVIGCTFRGNVARTGGGISNGGPSLFYQCLIIENSATWGSSSSVVNGGGVSTGSSPIFADCAIVSNTADYRGGGLSSNGTPFLTNCVFIANHAGDGPDMGGDGGGMSFWGAPTVSNCAFVGNHANSTGGGVYAQMYATGTLTDCVLNGNWAKLGGGIGCWGSPTLYNCAISGNTADLAGGLWTVGDTAMLGCTFAGNYAYGDFADGGGAVYNSEALAVAINCVLAYNITEDFCGGFYTCGGRPLLSNCILWHNRDRRGTGELSQIDDDCPFGYGHHEVSYSCINGWSQGGDGNIIVTDPGFLPPITGQWTADAQYDPVTHQFTFTDDDASWAAGELVGLFVNPDIDYGPEKLQFFIVDNTATTVTIWPDYGMILSGSSDAGRFDWYRIYDYHLHADSPCINRGDPSGQYVGQTDTDGDPRVVYGRVDIGADEYTGTLPPTKPALVATAAPPNGTLPKTQNNMLSLIFDMPLTLPGGDALNIVELADPNSDVSSGFTYQLDPDDPNGLTLKATENGAQLSNQTWYRIAPATALDVHAFGLDLCTLIGDADGGGRVTTADYSAVKAHLGERGETRYDLNGSGRVTTADYSVVKAHLGDQTPAKP